MQANGAGPRDRDTNDKSSPTDTGEDRRDETTGGTDPEEATVQDWVEADRSRPTLPEETADGLDDMDEEVRHQAEDLPLDTPGEIEMSREMTDEERIAKKAHALWEAEGHPHGRDQDHWTQAREMVAIEDSEKDTLLPRDTGAEEPVEERIVAIDNEGEAPGLTDTGEHDLTSTSREPTFKASPGASKPLKAVAKKAASAIKSEKVPTKKTRGKK